MFLKNSIKYLGFKDQWVRIIGVPILGFLVMVIFYREENIQIESFFASWFFSILYTFFYWHTNRYIVIKMRQWFPEPNIAMKRFFSQMALVLVNSLMVNLILDNSLEFIARGQLMENNDWQGFTVGISISLAAISLYEIAWLMIRLRDSELDKELLQRANIQSQLETLKSQVNPHFLFNSLNTLASLIPEDPDRAVDFVEKLSKVYRHILEIRDKQLNSLEEELKFTKAYLFLLKTRFGENLQVSIDVTNIDLEHSIVPLSLQLLLENAIKHNIISTQKPLQIKIYVEKGDKIIVKNNLQKKNQIMDSTKTGLSNIKVRYQYLTDQMVETIITTSSFIVTLPLIKTKTA